MKIKFILLFAIITMLATNIAMAEGTLEYKAGGTLKFYDITPMKGQGELILVGNYDGTELVLKVKDLKEIIFLEKKRYAYDRATRGKLIVSTASSNENYNIDDAAICRSDKKALECKGISSSFEALIYNPITKKSNTQIINKVKLQRISFD